MFDCIEVKAVGFLRLIYRNSVILNRKILKIKSYIWSSYWKKILKVKILFYYFKFGIFFSIDVKKFWLVFWVDGFWASWGSWGTCTVTCGGGIQTKTRSCTNPTPQYGGSDCTGFSTATQTCNTHNCPSTTQYTHQFNFNNILLWINVLCINMRWFGNMLSAYD